MEKVQATLDEILNRFTAMDTSVKTVSEEVTSLGKQVEEFGDEMDHIKRRVHDTSKSTPSSSSALHPETALPPTDKGNGVPLLANNHPPLLGTPQQQPSGFHHMSRTCSPSSTPNQIRRSTGRVNPAMIFRVSMAYKRLHRRLTWDEFMGAVPVVSEFGHDE